jgi:thioredoxin 1|tara:strand:+ start:155 stop:400 length:246 start_codon:yes stop_codon:yes gene_type:complete
MKTMKYFSAKWCGPCKAFKPIMNEIANEGKSVQFIDIDTQEPLARQYNVRSVPTVVIEENGVEVNRFVGTKPKQVVLEMIS